jgi:hypothetical protein
MLFYDDKVVRVEKYYRLNIHRQYNSIVIGKIKNSTKGE